MLRWLLPRRRPKPVEEPPLGGRPDAPAPPAEITVPQSSDPLDALVEPVRRDLRAKGYLP